MTVIALLFCVIPMAFLAVWEIRRQERKRRAALLRPLSERVAAVQREIGAALTPALLAMVPVIQQAAMWVEQFGAALQRSMDEFDA